MHDDAQGAFEYSDQDIRWGVNYLLEQIAAKFETWDTLDLFRSEAAATVRSFKHDLAAQPPAAPVETATKSAPVLGPPQNNAERLPSSDAAGAGAGTQCSADNAGATELSPECQCCDAGERCRGFCEQPLAYAVFAENGNIRIWSKTKTEVEVWAKDKGKVLTPLYARPAPIPKDFRQPIDTAPRDGTHILAWRIPLGIRVTNNTHPPTVVHWFEDPDEPGFYTSVNEIAPEHPFNPTHWMPLP
jgi:hypothetical protein